MKYDIGDLLNSWPFDPDEFIARRITARDGVEKVQIRIDMGMLQLEVTGRPDGQRPHGLESLLQHYRQKLGSRPATSDEEAPGLEEEACEDLFQEAWQYYQRYLALFYLEDYQGVVQDTTHNLDIFDLVQRHADSDEIKWYFEQYFPHAVMMRARARAMQALKTDNYVAAMHHVREGIGTIEDFLSQWEGEGEVVDDDFPELTFLRDWIEELEQERPLSDREQLERDLTVAVEAENFEEAARLRDKLRTMRPAFLSPGTPQRSR
ncbi:MAG: UvrB/UvrC motif-containing protein [Candidatus Latescibacterota bacterium]|nr:UvrB/UvrC motif-containing protein [Candidatus Latescibacterota bacterium]